MAGARAALHGERDVKEEFEALRADFDNLRKSFGAFVAEREATIARAGAAANREWDGKEDFTASRSDLDTLRRDFRTEAGLDAIRRRIAALNNMQTTGRQQGEKIEGMVHERPFMSLAVVFATGFLAGRLLHRR